MPYVSSDRDGVGMGVMSTTVSLFTVSTSAATFSFPVLNVGALVTDRTSVEQPNTDDRVAALNAL